MFSVENFTQNAQDKYVKFSKLMSNKSLLLYNFFFFFKANVKFDYIFNQTNSVLFCWSFEKKKRNEQLMKQGISVNAGRRQINL